MEELQSAEIISAYNITLKPSTRLKFSPLNKESEQDRKFYESLYLCPKTCRYIGGTKSPEQSGKLFEYICNNHRMGKLLQYKVVCIETEITIGVCALVWAKNRESVEGGLHLYQNAHRKGYGQEIINHLIHFAFTDLEITKVLYRYEKNNLGARKLALNLPFTKRKISETEWIVSPK